MSGLPAVVLLQQQGAPDYSFFLMMGAIFLIFYFLLIRPQQRRQKEHEKMLASVEKGDDVVTVGGLHGRVTGTSDDVLTVEVAVLKSGDRVRVKVQRSRIDSVQKPGAEARGGEKK